MKRTSTQTRKTRVPLFESLENRKLMSASPFVINGTAGNDVIAANFGSNLVVSQAATVAAKVTTAATAVAKAAVTSATTAKVVAAPITVAPLPITVSPTPVTPKAPILTPPLTQNRLTYTVNGVTNTAFLSSGQGIQINGLNGNDIITVTGKVNAQINGGAGNDSLTGGAGNDSIYGGDGNDVIRAGAGNDILDGGNGDDVIYGGAGSDTEYGDAGNDHLFGGNGVTFMYGGDGDDTLVSIGGTHYDRQWGGSGNNSFWLDSESTECVMDATAAEAATNVHRVAGYDGLHVNGTYVGTPSLNPGIGNLPDPTTSNPTKFTYKSFPNVPLFNNNTPIANDVNQGAAGDCYFMATLSAVAKENPNAIRQSIVDLGDGTYAVDFKNNGVNHYIRVDNQLPANSNGNLVDAQWRSGPPEMWVPIMEKAWAFYRHNAGTYASINNGNPSEAFNALGVSNNSYDPHWEGFLDLQSENATEFGNHICSLLDGGNAVVLCTPGDSKYLEESHCYMVDHVNWVNGKIASITLRNPWGTDGAGGDGVNDGYVTLTGLDVLESVNQVTWGKA
jgi:hypothetical protein